MIYKNKSDIIKLSGWFCTRLKFTDQLSFATGPWPNCGGRQLSVCFCSLQPAVNDGNDMGCGVRKNLFFSLFYSYLGSGCRNSIKCFFGKIYKALGDRHAELVWKITR